MASEFCFNLKETKIFQAVKWERSLVFRFVGLRKKLFIVLFILTFLIFLYGFLPQNFSFLLNQRLFGLSVILLALGIIFWLQELFLNLKLKQPRLPKISLAEAIENPGKYNLAEFLDFEAAKTVFKTINFTRSKSFSQIDSSILFYFLLKNNRKLNFIFFRALLDPKEINKILTQTFKIRNKGKFQRVFSDDFQDSILESFQIAQKRNHLRVGIGDMISGLAKHDLIFKKILINANLKFKDIENLTWWLKELEERIAGNKRFWEWKNLVKKGSLAKEWMAGYTINLDKFSTDLSKRVKMQGFPETVGHQEEIGAVERILARREENNVLIVGEPGTGRKSIIQALAVKSTLGQSLTELNYKRIVELDLPSLLAQIENKEEVGRVLDAIFREIISAGNIILVIDEFHNFVSGVARPGVIDISGVLASFLRLPQFQIVAITTPEGLHKYIEQNLSILSLFEKVEVSEISEEETLMLLKKLTLRLESRYKKFVSYPALRDIINYCAKYMSADPFPEKAMDLLDEIMVYVSQAKEKVVLPKHVAAIVSEKTKIPVGEIETKEREILINLEKLIHQRIINQEEAVEEVSSALRRARAEVTIRKGPMGSFLFLGPTGVGKTETSKALAQIYFGSEDRMIRLDMSEFQTAADISRLIGSPKEEGLLTIPVRENPFSLILLDEIEKTHPNILNLFLQVLDEGHVTDGLGRKIDFKNTIIIATSNAGYQIILDALKKNKLMSEIKNELLDFLFQKGIFRPEFINRFDAVVVFKVLSKENLLDISELMFRKLRKNLAKKDIEFIITTKLKEKIVELSYDPKFGAREMRRVIQDKIGDVLASALLSNELKGGDKVEIKPEDFSLKINP